MNFPGAAFRFYKHAVGSQGYPEQCRQVTAFWARVEFQVKLCRAMGSHGRSASFTKTFLLFLDYLCGDASAMRPWIYGARYCCDCNPQEAGD